MAPDVIVQLTNNNGQMGTALLRFASSLAKDRVQKREEQDLTDYHDIFRKTELS